MHMRNDIQIHTFAHIILTVKIRKKKKEHERQNNKCKTRKQMRKTKRNENQMQNRKLAVVETREINSSDETKNK